MPLYAKDIMSPCLVTLQPGMTCEEAAAILRSHQITGAPVIDERGNLLGVISITDILQTEVAIPAENPADYFSQTRLDNKMGETGFHIEPSEGFINDFMQRRVYTARPYTPITAIAELMANHRIHRIIITSLETGRPVGIVTSFDLLKVMSHMTPVSYGNELQKIVSRLKNRRITMQPVKEIMTANPRTCEADESILCAIEIMKRVNCGAVPVVASDNKLINIITDRDVALCLMDNPKQPNDIKIRDCIGETRQMITVSPDDDVHRAIDLMEENQVRRIVVINDQNGCIGIVAQADIALKDKTPKDIAELVHDISEERESIGVNF